MNIMIYYTQIEKLYVYNNIDISVTKTDYGRFKPYRRIVLTINEIIKNFEYYENNLITDKEVISNES